MSTAPSASRENQSVDPVLVVDDDRTIRDLFAATLRTAGMEVVTAVDGVEALELLVSQSFSVVLLDNQMPRKDGVEVITELRRSEETSTTPVVLVTAASDVEDRIKGLQAGASDYMTKPVNVHELVARVKAHQRSQHAWNSKIESRLQERSIITKALLQLSSEGSPSDTAAAICQQLSLLRNLRGACLVAFENGITTTLSSIGDLGFQTTSPLSPAWAQYLQFQTAQGPWVQRSDAVALAVDQGLEGPPSLVAAAPLGFDEQAFGVLVLVAPVESTASTLLLSAALDFAAAATGLLAPSLSSQGRDHERQAAISSIIDNKLFYPVFQPIVELATEQSIGYELLTRFEDGMRPDLRFMEATAVGKGTELELATLRAGLAEAEKLPADAFLSINVSPALVLEGEDLAELLSASGREVVLELTEHERVDDYDTLKAALSNLGSNVKLSVDDTGAGFASLSHVLALDPAFIKLDFSLVSGIHLDTARQALVAGVDYFASETQARLIAEGIELPEELEVLRRIGVDLGQGYLLGKPQRLETVAS